MMRRTSLSLVIALLSCFLLAAADGDLPDLEKVLEKHRALFQSIQSGRITYVRKRSLGTDDLEEFKKHYRRDAERKLREAKAAGADQGYLQGLRKRLDNYADEAAQRLMRGNEHQRVSYVFDKGANAAKDVTTDLRDVAGQMRRYGVRGEVQTYEQTRSRSIAKGVQKNLSGQPPRLSINPWKQPRIYIEPLSFAGYLLGDIPTTADDDENTESATLRRDTDNPNLIIHEAVSKPLTTERTFVMKGGKFESVEIPIDEPRTMKSVIVLDESKDYRVVSTTLFKNDRPTREYSFEYSSDDPLSLPKVATVTTYRDDGSVKMTQTLQMESVELNIEIAAAEFEIDVPPGTTIYDQMGPEMIVIEPDELHEVAEEVEDILEEEVIEVEEVPTEEPEAPDPVEAVEAPAAVAEDEAPAPAQDAPEEDGGGAITTVCVAFIVIVAIIAIALWARRRNR